MSTFHELGSHTDDDDFSDGADISDFQLIPGVNARHILVSDVTDLHKSGGINALNSSNISVNSNNNNNYFSFQAHTKETNSSQANQSLMSNDNASDHNNDGSPEPQLPQTDFAPRKGRLKYNAYSWFEMFRIKYLLLLSAFLIFVAIIMYFIIPRSIDAWIEITVQKLSFPNSDLNTTYLSMIITGHLYITNTNYLPITLESMKMDIYFNKTINNNNKNGVKHCKQTYLLSFITTFNELQNEQIYDVDYPFSVELNENITNSTLMAFKKYVNQSCNATGSYILRAHIYPQYLYTQTMHQIAFYTDTHANQGCQATLKHKKSKLKHKDLLIESG